MLLKINFDKGAAAEHYIWRNGILSNIAVYPNWEDFEFTKTMYPLSANTFQAFNINDPIISNLEFIFDEHREGPIAIVLNGQKAKRIRQ